MNNKEDYVFDQLKKELESKGLSIQSVDEENNCYIQVGDMNLKIYLDNTRRNFEKSQDDSVILDLVDTILAYDINVHETWENVKDKIFIFFYARDFDTEDFINKQVTVNFKKVYVYSDGYKRTQISSEDIEVWGVSEEELEAVANENAGLLLNDACLIFDDIDGHKLWRIDIAETSLRASVLFSNQLKNVLKEKTGLPFYAVLPERDSCYFFSKQDYDFFVEKMAMLVTEKYQNSAYPITTELLEFTDSEVKVAGKYRMRD